MVVTKPTVSTKYGEFHRDEYHMISEDGSYKLSVGVLFDFMWIHGFTLAAAIEEIADFQEHYRVRIK